MPHLFRNYSKLLVVALVSLSISNFCMIYAYIAKKEILLLKSLCSET